MPRIAPLYTQQQALTEAEQLSWEMQEECNRLAHLMETAGVPALEILGAIAHCDRAMRDVRQTTERQRNRLAWAR